jgi:hypothetical protein
MQKVICWLMLPLAFGIRSQLEVAVCSEGYPPYVIVNNSGISGYDVGEIDFPK